MKNEKLIILTDASDSEAIARNPEPGPATTAGEVLRLAIERGADTEQLERLLNLELRWRAYQAELAYQQAFLAFKQEPELRILKDELVQYETKKGTAEYRYSPLDKCEQVLIPLLAKHELTHHWRTEPQQNGWLKVTCVLTHVLCHRNDEASLMGPPDMTGSKNGHQAIGSNASYLERYTLCAACGVTPKNVDTDARVATIEAEEEKVDANGGNDQDLVPLLEPAVKAALEAKARACENTTKLRELWADMNEQQRENLRPLFNELREKLKEAACK